MKLLSMLPFDVRHKVEQAVHFDTDCFQVSLGMKNRCEWYQFLILIIKKKMSIQNCRLLIYFVQCLYIKVADIGYLPGAPELSNEARLSPGRLLL